MRCWRDWLVSSEGIRPSRADSPAVPACCPAPAAPLHVPGCPPRGGQSWGRCPGRCPPPLAPRSALSPGVPPVPGPLLALPAPPLAAESSGSGERGWGGHTPKSASAPCTCTPHPASRIHTRTRRRGVTWSRPGRGVPGDWDPRGEGEGGGGGMLPGDPAVPASPGGAAGAGGGGCSPGRGLSRGWDDKTGGVIAFRQMRLPRPSPSPGI